MKQSGAGDSVLDMEFPVEVWLASERVLLDDLLKLKPGEVLPLTGNPEEKVDLVANGVTLASGELVVVDGKFGVRVTETATRKLAQLDPDAGTEGQG
jgi:flagellar motor switch protein FliN/FliY